MEKEKMSWETFDNAIGIITTSLKKNNFKPDIIIAIPKGGLVIGTTLANILDIPLISDCDIEHKGTNVLLVDDIADTGNTLLNFLFNLRESNPNLNVQVATLYYNQKSKYQPDIYAFITNKWIVFPWERELKDENKDTGQPVK